MFVDMTTDEKEGQKEKRKDRSYHWYEFNFGLKKRNIHPEKRVYIHAI